jgi:hypothetical protein
LRDVAPDEFYNSEFYRLFYSQVGLSDYVDILWRIDTDNALSVFLERDTSSVSFLPENIAAINTVLPIIFAAVEKHYGKVELVPARGDNDAHTSQGAKYARQFRPFTLDQTRARSAVLHAQWVLFGIDC